MERILVVEDSPDFQLVVKSVLEPAYRVDIAPTLEAAEKRVAETGYDLILLDVVLPDGEGFEFCENLRTAEEGKRIPLIFLSARNELEDKLKGFSLGADDYIVKPFQALELRARVDSRLTRERERNRDAEVVTKSGLRFEIPTQRAFLLDGDKKVDMNLTPIEFKILYFLFRSEGRVVSRETLLSVVWGEGTHVFDRATDKHVSSVRQKLGVRAPFIRTVARVGYCFDSSRTI